MKKLFLLALLPSLALAQAVQPPEGFLGDFQSGWQAFNTAGSQPAVIAPFRNARCVVSGQGAGKNAPLTTTRASTQTYVTTNPNQQTPGLIPEDAGTVAHVVITPNLTPRSEGLVSQATSAANVTDAAMPGFDNAWQFPGSAANANFYPAYPTYVVGTFYTASAFVQMDDGSAPRVGDSSDGTKDLTLVTDNAACSAGHFATPMLVSGALYRVSCTRPSTNGGVLPTGVARYATQSGKGFRASGFNVAQSTAVLPYAKTTNLPGFYDTRGNAWTQNGTVPLSPASWYAPPSAGAFSAANYYTGGTSLGEWTGDWTATFVFTPSNFTAINVLGGKHNPTQTQGWLVYTLASTGTMTLYVANASPQQANTPNAAVLGVPNVVTVGRAGGLVYIKLNGGVSGSTVTNGAMTPAPAELFSLGRWMSTAYPLTGGLYEVHASTTPWSEAAVTALQASVMACIGQGMLKTCNANEAAVSPQGLEVWAAYTNVLANGTAHDLSNVGWTTSGTPTITINNAVAPDGTLTMDTFTGTAASDVKYQTITTGVLGPWTMSVWTRAVSGSASSVVRSQTSGGSVSTCTCGTDYAPISCSTGINGGTCWAAATVGTTPVRLWATALFTGASTAVVGAIQPGTFAAAAGASAQYWGAHFVQAGYPTPFATGAALATTATVPLPALHTTNTWCIGVTATPGGGRAWASGNTSQGSVFSGGAPGTINSFYLRTSSGSNPLYFGLYDSTPTQKYVSCAITGWAAGSPHRLVACNAAGTMSIYDGGVKCSGSATGSTGLLSATPASLYVGGDSTPQAFDGELKDLRIYPSQTYRSGM